MQTICGGLYGYQRGTVSSEQGRTVNHGQAFNKCNRSDLHDRSICWYLYRVNPQPKLFVAVNLVQMMLEKNLMDIIYMRVLI